MINKILFSCKEKYSKYKFYILSFLLMLLSFFLIQHEDDDKINHTDNLYKHTIIKERNHIPIKLLNVNLKKVHYGSKNTSYMASIDKIKRNKDDAIEKIISPYKKVFIKKINYIKNKKDILKILSRKNLVKPILMVSGKTKVPARLIAAIIHVESNGHSQAVSSAGAMGLMQISKNIARHYNVNPYVSYQNIEAGTKYIKHLIIRFHSLRLALAAYNAGPSFVINNGCTGEPEIYATKVMYYYYYS